MRQAQRFILTLLDAPPPDPVAEAARHVHALVWAEGAAAGGLDKLSVEALALMGAADEFLSRALASQKEGE